ncbi:deoxyuridine 5'-triphosphate nucleotidohydrolase [Methanohalophilus sp.]|uniref:deoxyuridine 5'-triphosphate nucleotidohydrolase n=1 Tax=Methanohalophilus sp. TaxID=1966352 RepID=UPI002602B388|nr:deoxyuridine 5'-triphosphate nucleotidohydrolase [Methanohalophilus sp.]MDK2892901.1 dUTP pyrophosphatase [Methanohalophilus sp.]
MALLSKNRLLELIHSNQPLVEGMKDECLQVQPNGIELTLKEIHLIEGMGTVDFDNSERVIPKTTPLKFSSDGWIELGTGIYKIIFNEIVNIPKDTAALATPRSSIIRCGATLETAVWDAGYRGRSECLLVVFNKDGIRLQKNARVIQLVFYSMESAVDKGYCGRYQNENC